MTMYGLPPVIASPAIAARSNPFSGEDRSGLLWHFVPRNDGKSESRDDGKRNLAMTDRASPAMTERGTSQ